MSENDRGATVGASDPKADAKRQAALQGALSGVRHLPYHFRHSSGTVPAQTRVVFCPGGAIAWWP